MKTILVTSLFCFGLTLAFAQPKQKSLAERLFERSMTKEEKLAKDIMSNHRVHARKQLLVSSLDSAKSYSWSLDASAWELREIDYYFYGHDADTVLSVDENYENGYLDVTTYDVNGNIHEFLGYSWNGVDWTLSSRLAYEYNDQQQVTEYILQINFGDSLENISRQVYTYDGNGGRIEEISMNWDFDTWRNSRRFLITNNAQNYPVAEVDQDWEGDWVTKGRYLTTYTAQNQRLEYTYESWIGDWDPRYRIQFVYDAGMHLTNEIFQDYEFGVWLPTSQTIYEYDNQGNTAIETYQQDDGSGWYNVERYRSAYDQEQNQIIWINEEWDNAWINYDSTHYYYTIISSVQQTPLIDFISVYPNPVSTILHWNADIELSFSHVYVLNMHGHKLQVPFDLESGKMNVTSLLPGMYILTLRTDKGMSRTRFIKQ
jgi:hypothetical protein